MPPSVLWPTDGGFFGIVDPWGIADPTRYLRGALLAGGSGTAVVGFGVSSAVGTVAVLGTTRTVVPSGVSASTAVGVVDTARRLPFVPRLVGRQRPWWEAHERLLVRPVQRSIFGPARQNVRQVVPTGVVGSVALGLVTFPGSPRVVQPTGIAATTALGASTPRGSAQPAPSGVSAALQLGTVLAQSNTNRTVQATGVSSVLGLGAATVRASRTQAVVGTALTAALGTATAAGTSGNWTVQASGVSASTTLGNESVQVVQHRTVVPATLPFALTLGAIFSDHPATALGVAIATGTVVGQRVWLGRASGTAEATGAATARRVIRPRSTGTAVATGVVTGSLQRSGTARGTAVSVGTVRTLVEVGVGSRSLFAPFDGEQFFGGYF